MKIKTMFRTILSVSALAACAVFAGPALAQTSNVYVGGGYTQFEGDNASVGGLTGRLGVGFGQYFAVEGEASVGVVDDNVRVGAANVNVELDSAFGLFGVAKAPISPQFDLFARIGWAQTDVSGRLGSLSGSADDNGLAYGVGGNFWLTEKDGIRGDYTRYDFDGDSKLDTYAISYVRKF